MQTLFTIEDPETGGIKTELHVTTPTEIGLAVIIYVSDEFGTHKKTVRKNFIRSIDYLYHRNLRLKIKREGGLIHKRISDTPLPKSKSVPKSYFNNRDRLGRFSKN